MYKIEFKYSLPLTFNNFTLFCTAYKIIYIYKHIFITHHVRRNLLANNIKFKCIDSIIACCSNVLNSKIFAVPKYAFAVEPRLKSHQKMHIKYDNTVRINDPFRHGITLHTFRKAWMQFS